MTIPRLEGFDEEIGPALASLTDTIGQLVKPTAKYDHALKALFIEKPELMQKFVDIEKENPGTLRAFGFGEGPTNLLSGMQESIPSIRERLGRETLDSMTPSGANARETAGRQAATGETPTEADAAAFQRWMISEGRHLASTDPQAFDSAVSAFLKIPGQQERQVMKDTAGVYLQGRKLADMSIPDIVTGLQNGSIKNEDINAGLLHPAAQAGVKAALAEYSFNREADLRRDLGQMQAERTRAGSTALETAMRRAAYDQFAASGGVAPVGAFYEAMWGEPYKGTAAPKEQLDAVNKWLQTSQADKSVKRSKDLLSGIAPLYNQTIRKKGQRPPTKELVQKNIGQINDLLSQSGSRWRAQYDEVGHWFRANEPQIIFRDDAGNVTNDPTPLLSQVSAPGSVIKAADDPEELNPYQRQVVSQLSGLGAGALDSAITDMYEAAGAKFDDRTGQWKGGDQAKMDVIQKLIDNLPAQ